MIPKALSEGEETLALQLRIDKIPFQRQFKFHPNRKFRSDFLLTGTNILCEIHGGVWNRGAHVRGHQFTSDREKSVEAAKLGYRCLEFTTAQVKSGFALDAIKSLLKISLEK